ncbi:MAG: matrixin family metalloprotease [Candidatus Obscuribacter sp.]|nr:matrixin family metalloprotease [Candidatus Obscuribacter sp.]MBP6347996.1 matrixin family metalloprotease [Candidatus Obscuribacter sp.]MBP6591449.1 matrixin family metalloprotease [Candidatus Obscuribacter sp.]MBP7575125.1 matrixin family metalloprotease [Candidatus Obscuribacter sp.]
MMLPDSNHQKFMQGVALYEQANKLRDLGEYDIANQLYVKAQGLLHQKLDVTLFYDMGLHYDFAGQLAKSNSCFRDCINAFAILSKNDPQNPVLDNLRPLVKSIEELLRGREAIAPDSTTYLDCLHQARWPKSSLTVFINETHETGFAIEVKAQIKHAIEKWTEPLQWQYQLTGYLEDADIVIERALPPTALQTAGGQTTYKYLDQDCSIISQAKIQIFNGQYHYQDSAPPRFYSLILHELGHAFGLDGHSPFGPDLMYWKSKSVALTSRDLATLKKLYQKMA